MEKITFNGEAYTLTTDAAIDNRGDSVAFFAHATDEAGEDCQVIWLPSQAWLASCAVAALEVERDIPAHRRTSERTDSEISAAIADVWDSYGLTPADAVSVEDCCACDWDNPDEVIKL